MYFLSLKAPAFTFTSPVWDDSGKIVGVLRVQYNAVILHNTVMTVATKWEVPDLYAVLIDDQYYIRLSHTLDYGLMYKSYAPWMSRLLLSYNPGGAYLPEPPRSYLPTNRLLSVG